jgi:hypothetical protein
MVGDGLDQSFVDIYKLPGNEYCRNVIETRGIYPLRRPPIAESQLLLSIRRRACAQSRHIAPLFAPY